MSALSLGRGGGLWSEVEVDSEGLSAVNMESILSSWPEGKRKPKAV